MATKASFPGHPGEISLWLLHKSLTCTPLRRPEELLTFESWFESKTQKPAPSYQSEKGRWKREFLIINFYHFFFPFSLPFLSLLQISVHFRLWFSPLLLNHLELSSLIYWSLTLATTLFIKIWIDCLILLFIFSLFVISITCQAINGCANTVQSRIKDIWYFICKISHGQRVYNNLCIPFLLFLLCMPCCPCMMCMHFGTNIEKRLSKRLLTIPPNIHYFLSTFSLL